MTSRRFFSAILAIAALTLYLVPAAYAQAGMGKAHRMYDPTTETTISGTIEEVHTIAGRGGWSGLHLTLKTEDGEFDVHVGPAAYVEKEHFTFAKGDEIEVTGSKVMYEEHDAIIAREIVKDGETLTLRDAHGYPEWAGRWRDTSK
jgi:DNA/RNA endonuclease YhcR with UshA esterase domain